MNQFPMRQAILLGVVLLCSGCGIAHRDAWQSIHMVFAGKPQAHPTAASITRLPYPQLLLEYTGGSATLVMGNVDDDLQSWYSNDRKIIYLRSNGLLVGSHGLSMDVADIRLEGGNPFVQLVRTHQTTTTTTRHYDWMPGYRYNVAVTGQLEVIGSEPVQFPDTTRELLHVREHLRGPGIEADNDYWVDPGTGFVWKSRQLLAPGVMLGITQLKPYLPERAQ